MVVEVHPSGLPGHWEHTFALGQFLCWHNHCQPLGSCSGVQGRSVSAAPSKGDDQRFTTVFIREFEQQRSLLAAVGPNAWQDEGIKTTRHGCQSCCTFACSPWAFSPRPLRAPMCAPVRPRAARSGGVERREEREADLGPSCFAQ